jgi:DNA modification methylase
MTRFARALQRLGAKHSLGYATNLGSAWRGDSLQLLRCLPDESVNAIITSPPFALVTKKEYGNVSHDEYLDWFMPFATQFQRVLRDDGSLIIEIGGNWLPGVPVRSLYHFELASRLVRELGFYLAQDFFWVNDARIPAPAAWVCQARVRVKDAVNPIWWLGKTQHPKADNRQVLAPYSAAFSKQMKKRVRMKVLQENLGLDTHGETKYAPSGYRKTEGNFSVDHGGSIPDNLLRCTNSAAVDEATARYFKYCQQHGYKPHPARFPPAIPEFFIKLLTQPGDVVLDPFGGSNTTGELADSLGRHWLSFELKRRYLRASIGRFHQSRLLARPPRLPQPRYRRLLPPAVKFKMRAK